MSTAMAEYIAREAFGYYKIDPFEIPVQPACMKDGSPEGDESWINFVISCKEEGIDVTEPFWYCNICLAPEKLKMARAGKCGKIIAKYKGK